MSVHHHRTSGHGHHSSSHQRHNSSSSRSRSRGAQPGLTEARGHVPGDPRSHSLHGGHHGSHLGGHNMDRGHSKGPSLDRQITIQDVECLREAFALFDPDTESKELLTPDRLGKVLRKHGFRPTERELHTMITNVDSHEGGIDFDEFIELLVNHGRNLEDDIAKSFRMFDIDGDGLITEDELRTTMSNLGEPMNDSEVKAMIAEADLDGDGKINFKEFQILMDNKTL